VVAVGRGGGHDKRGLLVAPAHDGRRHQHAGLVVSMVMTVVVPVMMSGPLLSVAMTNTPQSTNPEKQQPISQIVDSESTTVSGHTTTTAAQHCRTCFIHARQSAECPLLPPDIFPPAPLRFPPQSGAAPRAARSSNQTHCRPLASAPPSTSPPQPALAASQMTESFPRWFRRGAAAPAAVESPRTCEGNKKQTGKSTRKRLASATTRRRRGGGSGRRKCRSAAPPSGSSAQTAPWPQRGTPPLRTQRR
jgi:hypothetical protein